EVELEGAEDVQVLVDGRRELGGGGPGEVDRGGEVPGDRVGERTSRSEAELLEQCGVRGAGVRHGVSAGQVKRVTIRVDDRMGMRVHDLHDLPAGVGPRGQVVAEHAAQGTEVLKVAGDGDRHVEHRRGQYLGQHPVA